jgi:hypothetical protein
LIVAIGCLTALSVVNNTLAGNSGYGLNLEALTKIWRVIVGRVVGRPWNEVVLGIIDQSVELISADLLIAVVIIDREKLVWSMVVALASNVWVGETVDLAHRSVTGKRFC